MKRIICSVLSVLLIVLVPLMSMAETVFDEDFSIRNGIKNGMSIEEIKSIEIRNGNEESVKDYNLFFGDEVKATFLTKLAGMDSLIFYWVDENACLKEFQYWLLDSSAYDTLENTLITKYGQPFTTDVQIPFQTRIMTLYDGTRGNPKVTNYASWLLQYNDCCVVVELMSFIEGKFECTNLNYCLVSHEEVETVMNKIANESEAAIQSANDDL